MVQYVDPELGEEFPQEKNPRLSPAEKIRKQRERNAALSHEAAVEKAREVALRRLDQRAQSIKEVRDALKNRGFSSESIDEVIGRLTSVHLLDDVAYARSFVSSRFGGAGKVGHALRQDLQRKGISDAIIGEFLGDIDMEDLYERARALVRSKARSLATQSRDVQYRRLVGMLSRKGYSGSIISTVVNEAIEEWAHGEKDPTTHW